MLVLASQSPRRAALLQQIGVSFTLIDAPVDESWQTDESLDHYVARVSVMKAQQAATMTNPQAIILTADTAGWCRSKPLVKPRDKADAMAMLALMSGSAHTVSTAVTVYQPATKRLETVCVASTVHFRTLSRAECHAYWDSGEPCDKAGSYAIQGLGAVFVRRLEGSYSGVMGLPLCETALLLQQFGISVWQNRLDNCKP